MDPHPDYIRIQAGSTYGAGPEPEYDPDEAAERRYFDLADPAYVADLRGQNLEGDGEDWLDQSEDWYDEQPECVCSDPNPVADECEKCGGWL